MIQVENLTKRFGGNLAVDGLSFEARTGRVTGFLGPNGSGKSTTMRCIVGLDQFERGTATVNGRQFASLPAPLHEVGVLLDAGYVHLGRTARNHLRWLAASNHLPAGRVDEVLEMVGLTQVADVRVREYSLGMKQRLGIAAAMIGDPSTIILDEPGNGLDPEGIRWIRDFLRHLASQGCTVLVSSHLLAEMALMADDLVVIGRGRLIDQCTTDQFVARNSRRWVRVTSPQVGALVAALGSRASWTEFVGDPATATTARLHGIDTIPVGEFAAANGIVLHELVTETESLEEAFLRVTAGSQQYRSEPQHLTPGAPQQFVQQVQQPHMPPQPQPQPQLQPQPPLQPQPQPHPDHTTGVPGGPR